MIRRRTFLALLASVCVAPLGWWPKPRRPGLVKFTPIRPTDYVNWRNYSATYIHEPRIVALARLRKEYGLTLDQCREVLAIGPAKWELVQKLHAAVKHVEFQPPMWKLTG